MIPSPTRIQPANHYFKLLCNEQPRHPHTHAAHSSSQLPAISWNSNRLITAADCNIFAFVPPHRSNIDEIRFMMGGGRFRNGSPRYMQIGFKLAAYFPTHCNKQHTELFRQYATFSTSTDFTLHTYIKTFCKCSCDLIFIVSIKPIDLRGRERESAINYDSFIKAGKWKVSK